MFENNFEKLPFRAARESAATACAFSGARQPHFAVRFRLFFVGLFCSYRAIRPIPFCPLACYLYPVPCICKFEGVGNMEWETPQHEEIDLNCEVSSYANAEL
jgi:hypothetical protein